MMVFPQRLNWLQIMFKVRGSILTRIWGRVLITFLFATAITELYFLGILKAEVETLTPLPFSLIGLALGIFLGFRNNTSYQRFWEGRILWGRLVNTSRTITRQILTLIEPEQDPSPSPLQRHLVHRVAAYVHALRLHLRDEKEGYADLKRLLPDDDLEALAKSSNPPIAMLHTLGERMAKAWQQGKLNEYHMSVLEQSLTNLTDIQGGCERIKATPIPFSYTLLIHRIVAVYCLALPFGVYDQAKLLTPLVVLLVSYAFYGLDAIGDEIASSP